MALGSGVLLAACDIFSPSVEVVRRWSNYYICILLSKYECNIFREIFLATLCVRLSAGHIIESASLHAEILPAILESLLARHPIALAFCVSLDGLASIPGSNL